MNSPQSHRKLVFWLFVVTLSMFAFGYALVPLYNVLMQNNRLKR